MKHKKKKVKVGQKPELQAKPTSMASDEEEIAKVKRKKQKKKAKKKNKKKKQKFMV